MSHVKCCTKETKSALGDQVISNDLWLTGSQETVAIPVDILRVFTNLEHGIELCVNVNTTALSILCDRMQFHKAYTYL